MQHRLAAVGAWLFLRQRQASFDGLLFVAGLRGQVRTSTGTTQAGAGDWFFLCLRQAAAEPGLWFSRLERVFRHEQVYFLVHFVFQT